MISMYHRQLTGEGDGRDLGAQMNGTCKRLGDKDSSRNQ